MESTIQGFSADYEVEAGNTSLILTKANLNNHEIINFQVEMINNNQIPGVLNLNLRQKDLDYKFYYNVTGKVTLANYLRRQKVSKYQFINIIDGILKTILASKSYFLDNNSFILNENFIYLDPKGQHVDLIYLPLELKQNIIPGFKTFLSDLLINSVSLETTDNFIQSILRLVRTEELNLMDISSELQKMKNSSPDLADGDAENISPINPSNFNLEHSFNNTVPFTDDSTAHNNSMSIFSYQEELSPKADIPGKLNYRKPVLGILAVISVLAAFLSTQEGGLGRALHIPNGLKYLVMGGGLIAFGLVIIFLILIKPKQQNEDEQLTRYNNSLTELENSSPRLANPLLTSTYVAESIAVSSQASPQALNPSLPNQFGQQPELEVPSQRDETVLLTDLKVPMLKVVNGRELIIINQPEFIIGRNGDSCNYCLQEPSLGRAHVKIQKIEDAFYVIDLDSKNGTFMNGQRLISNKPYLLQNNEKLKLANVELVFQV